MGVALASVPKSSGSASQNPAGSWPRSPEVCSGLGLRVMFSGVPFAPVVDSLSVVVSLG